MTPRVRPLSYWAELDAKYAFVEAARQAQHRGCMYGIELFGDLVFVFLPRTTWAEINELTGGRNLSSPPRAF